MADVYNTIDDPYNAQLVRQPDVLDLTIGGGSVDQSVTQQQQAALATLAQPGGNTAASSSMAGGSVQQASVASGGAMSDITISNSIQSTNWAPKTVGFYMNGQTGYAEFSSIFVKGAVAAGSFDIPDVNTINSFHVDPAGNTWWGTTPTLWLLNHDNAVAYVLNTGVAKFQNIAITGGSVVTGVLNKGVQSWTTDIVFSSASATQINYSSGHIFMQDGTTYTIGAGNTGTMSAATYIYLDINVSTIALQTTTTYTTATGDGKVLIATAQNNNTAASVVPFGGGQPVLDGAANIAALSITAASIAATTITAAKMSVTQLSAISANLGTITAGSITVVTGSNTVAITPGATNAIISGPTGAPTFVLTQGGNLTVQGGTITGAAISTTSGGSSRIDMGSDRIDVYSSSVLRTRIGSGLIEMYNSSASEQAQIAAQTNGLGILAGGVTMYDFETGAFYNTNSASLGSNSHAWVDAYLAGNVLMLGKLRIPVGTNLF